jgi:hypothetical protein
MQKFVLAVSLLSLLCHFSHGAVFGDFTYEVANNTVTITRYTGTMSVISVPSDIAGLPVITIGNYSFVDCTSLTSITIPDSVTRIGHQAFQGCTSLTSITIPDSVTRIGDLAFWYCTSLTSITIPNSVTMIEGQLFASCTNLTSITIPESVTSIGEAAFTECTSLSSITIPESVTSIGEFAFNGCTSLTNITIPNGVTIIGDFAFNGCTSLSSVILSNSVTIVGGSAFANCVSLTSIVIPGSVTSIGDSVFNGCTSLTNITIPERFIVSVGALGLPGDVASRVLIEGVANNLASNDAFITALANKIIAKTGNYGLATKSELSTLATKSELTAALTESRTAGINSVLSNPNLWTLYTTSQIQNMAIGDLVLTRNVNGVLVLNYDIEQSDDLQTWTTYEAVSLPLTNLPMDKAFVRIKVK